MDIDLIEKIFPHISQNEKLKYDKEGLWSITHPTESNKITNIIKIFLKKKFNDNLKSNVIITDATAGLGGNTISFSNNFYKVNSIEICKKRFEMLKNNMKIYNFKNLILYNDNFVNIIDNLKQDVVFIDPPWGGPDYKLKKKVNININNIELYKIVNNLFGKCKIVCLKLPKNFNVENFVSNVDYSVYKYNVKNLMILIVDIS